MKRTKHSALHPAPLQVELHVIGVANPLSKTTQFSYLRQGIHTILYSVHGGIDHLIQAQQNLGSGIAAAHQLVDVILRPLQGKLELCAVVLQAGGHKYRLRKVIKNTSNLQIYSVTCPALED